ncbi:MAG TPA: ArsC family reductase [Pseudogulbenkiania sp.]|jgi:Spx/MgsR family transcriptional regulator|nr:ArsC family reductase [Pseudogulbenkiania sp.]
MTTTLYGIPNCDTVKKARQWLAQHQIDYVFHDFKKQGIAEARLQHWIEAVGLGKIINRQGTTWRKLSDADKALADDAVSAIGLIQANPSLIKRPVLERGDRVELGFKEDLYGKAFGQ